MKFLIIFSFILMNFNLYAQPNKSTYGKVIYNLSKNNNSDLVEMYFNNSEYRLRKMKSLADTLTNQQYLKKIDDIENDQTLSPQEKVSLINSNLPNASFYGKRDNDYFLISSIMKKDYCVADSQKIKFADWELINTSDTIINNIRCGRAKGILDTEKYIAYYAIDIPTNLAPYQFRGLPGLLIYVENIDNPNKKLTLKIYQLDWPLYADNVKINLCDGIKIITQKAEKDERDKAIKRSLDALERHKKGEKVTIDEIF
ncbi:GLPGLI family protein [Polluticaenibacter yanchengensis]|uniref:GLPGLI family protein n=1 Tax=Polluticaenibacter yanchengensis TaxID=3014562 RepID=A0ABT4UN81_9BACT|nr:GLPGLI family protein [Chitinophagaceae bacterium LY-5]